MLLEFYQGFLKKLANFGTEFKKKMLEKFWKKKF